ncbi:MAG: RDD family protein, partial [Gammaproteobacteria bacterium]|nr:RDD family protein [Gammaproteobacteria bacterium]
GGQTIGMRAWRLQLVGRGANRITWARATLRFAAAAVSALPLGAGYLWCLVDRQRLAWHDRASQSMLIVLPKR